MTTQSKPVSIRQFVNTGSLPSFIVAIFLGLGTGAMWALTPTALIVLGLAAVLLIIKHQSDWIVYVAGILIGLLLFQFAGVVLPEFVAYVVVILGAWFF